MRLQSVLRFVVVSLMLCATAALAQYPAGLKSWDVLQNGVVVGELYVEGSAASYTEHWVLLPGYVTPGNGVSVEVVEGTKTYADAKEFFARVHFPKGSRYVKAACADSTTLP